VEKFFQKSTNAVKKVLLLFPHTVAISDGVVHHDGGGQAGSQAPSAAAHYEVLTVENQLFIFFKDKGKDKLKKSQIDRYAKDGLPACILIPVIFNISQEELEEVMKTPSKEVLAVLNSRTSLKDLGIVGRVDGARHLMATLLLFYLDQNKDLLEFVPLTTDRLKEAGKERFLRHDSSSKHLVWLNAALGHEFNASTWMSYVVLKAYY
jgi:hypothetical protein